MYKITYFEPHWGKAECAALARTFVPWPTKRKLIASIQETLSPAFPNRRVGFFCSGKSAIFNILKQWRVGSGDEVILPAFVCSSAVQPVMRLGATPIAADVDTSDLNMSVESFKACLTKKTKAVIVAHLYGNPASIQDIQDICRAKGILLLDDAAQSFGASLYGAALGGWGDAGVISFSPGKSTVGVQGAFSITEVSLPKPLNEANIINDTKRYLDFILRRCLRRWTQPMIEFTKGNPNAAPNPRWAGMASFVDAPMRKADASIARVQIKQVLEKRLAQRRDNFLLLQETFSPLKSVQIIAAQRGESSYVKFVLVLPSGLRSIFEQLQKNGLEVRPSYLPLTCYKPSLSGVYYADTLGYRVLELPLGQSTEETRWMGEMVRDQLQKSA